MPHSKGSNPLGEPGPIELALDPALFVITTTVDLLRTYACVYTCACWLCGSVFSRNPCEEQTRVVPCLGDAWTLFNLNLINHLAQRTSPKLPLTVSGVSMGVPSLVSTSILPSPARFGGLINLT